MLLLTRLSSVTRFVVSLHSSPLLIPAVRRRPSADDERREWEGDSRSLRSTLLTVASPVIHLLSPHGPPVPAHFAHRSRRTAEGEVNGSGTGKSRAKSG